MKRQEAKSLEQKSLKYINNPSDWVKWPPYEYVYATNGGRSVSAARGKHVPNSRGITEGLEGRLIRFRVEAT